MTHPIVPSGPLLTRRATLAQLAVGGVAVSLAHHADLTLAQENTAQSSPVAVPPALDIWVSGWEAGDADQIASAYGEGAVVEVVPFGTTVRGQDAIRQYYTAYFGAFEAPDSRITAIFATSDRAAVEWTFHGQYTGQLPGLPPGDGQPVSVRGVNIMELGDGAITVERIYTDLAGLLGQLGLDLSLPGTPAAATPVS